MSADRIYLQNSALHVKGSPEYVPYSKVRIIVGEDEEGTQLVYEAGDDSFRTLEIENPWGTQAIANSILAKIQGYAYKPFTADGAILNPVAEIGDAVSVGGVYSFLGSVDTTFSPIMSANISAPEDSTIDHEYPYESSEHKEIVRRVNGAKASFIVELGRIEASLEDYQKKEDMDGYVEERTLNASIGAYIDSVAGTAQIIAAASSTYQRKDQMGNYVLASSLNTSIGQYIDSQAGTAKIISAASGTYQTKAAMAGYVTSASLDASIGQYIDTQAGTAKIVAACSGTYQTQSGMSGYVKTTELNTSIGQYIDSRAGTAKIESAISATYQTKAAMSGYVQTTTLNNSITQYVNSATGKNTIVASVSGSFAGKSYESRVEVSESKIGWLIKSGTSASNFTMTDRAIQLTAGSIDLSGYVTFTSLSTKGSTAINGDNITTGTINADRIDAKELKVKTIYAYGSASDRVAVIDTATKTTLYIGGTNATWCIDKIQIMTKTVVDIGRSDNWNYRIGIDVANRVIRPNSDDLYWSIGDITRGFQYIYSKGHDITYMLAIGRYKYVGLRESGSDVIFDANGSSYSVILGSTQSRFKDLYVSNAHICDTAYNATLSFFGTTGAAKQTLSTSSTNMGYTSATASNYLVILNNVVGILSKKYGMFAS